MYTPVVIIALNVKVGLFISQASQHSVASSGHKHHFRFSSSVQSSDALGGTRIKIQWQGRRRMMPLSVQRPAISSPNAPSGISVRAFFEEKLFSSPVAFVPKNYEFSGDPKKKLGEEAEKKVFDLVGDAGRDIPGIQIVCFHGYRVIGRF